MIRVPGQSGVVFTEEKDGDQRSDEARADVAATLGLSPKWATVRQVHGATVVRATRAGDMGEADAMWTDLPGLPLAVFTADCLGVVLISAKAIGIAHAGWRGVDQEVVPSLLSEMGARDHTPSHAVVGPGIGSCCFEVGPEVAARFSGHVRKTTWGTDSVDLVGVVKEQLGTIPTTVIDGCTMHEERWFSHRRDGTRARLGAIAWM